MKLARNIDRGVLVVATVALALPALARANPLLSGYGGPGQGSQALLGATLTGPRGGGGASSSGEATPASAIEAPAASTAAAQTQGTPSGTKHASTRNRRSQHSSSAPAGAGSSGASGPTQTGLVPARSVHADTAGLSSGDLALILLGIGVVAATGILMARLARGQEREGRDS
jgi:hypothetical protein